MIPILRHYQQDMIDDVTTAAAGGKRRILLQAVMGSGKTHIAAHIIRHATSNGYKSLFLCHRREILFQTQDKLRRYGVDPGIILRDEPNDPTLPCQVASIQSLHSKVFRYRKQWLPPAELVIVDEVHALPSSTTWARIINEYPEAIILGLTATPITRQGAGLGSGDFFDEIVCGPSMSELQKQGFLVKVRYFCPSIPDLRGVKMSQGDYAEGDLQHRMDIPKLIGDVCENWSRVCPERKTLVFASGVRHSIHIAERFNAMGIKAAHVDAKTPTEERDGAVKRFTEGDLQVMSSCGIFAEGTDLPIASALIFARPTKSLRLYLQICLDMETEILSKRGWLKHDEVCEKDEIASFSTETSEILFTKVEEKIERQLCHAVGERMYCLDSPHLSIRVTADHEILHSPPGVAFNNSWKKSTAESLASKLGGFVIPVSGHEQGGEAPISDSDIRFIGLFLTDGCINKTTNCITISQSMAKPIENHKYIKKTLEECGFKWGEFRVLRKGALAKYAPLIQYNISYGMPRGSDKHKTGWARLASYLSKTSFENLELLNERQFGILLEAMFLGNGATRKNAQWTPKTFSISWGNKKLCDYIQSLAVRRGYRCNMHTEIRTWKPGWGHLPLYTIHYSKKGMATVGGFNADNGRSKFRIDDKGPESVWCVRTALGTLITRRKGKVAIIGNCGRILRTYPNKKDAILIDHSGVLYEHGLLEDDREWKLDYGKDKTSSQAFKLKNPDKKKRQITCEKCKCVYEGRLDCPECGTRPTVRGKAVQTFEAYLQEITAIEKPPAPDKRYWWQSLKGYAAMKGYRPVFAYWKYKEKFGVGPSNQWSSDPSVEPGLEVLSWIKSRQIAWAHSKRNPNNQKSPVGAQTGA